MITNFIMAALISAAGATSTLVYNIQKENNRMTQTEVFTLEDGKYLKRAYKMDFGYNAQGQVTDKRPTCGTRPGRTTCSGRRNASTRPAARRQHAEPPATTATACTFMPPETIYLSINLIFASVNAQSWLPAPDNPVPKATARTACGK